MDERAGAVGQAIETLRELPDVRPEATARLLIAVAAERQRDRERGRAVQPRRWIQGAMAAAAAAVVAVAIFSLPAIRHRGGPPATGSPRSTTGAPPLLTSTSASTAGDATRAVELVFSAPAATSVRVVGDFNGWDERQAPMARDKASGLWSVHLMLKPGRHVYAFVVNDTQWVRDPRSAAAPDADFGRPGSVVLVGRP